jgi:uncharacterized protein (TIGR04255 family)
MTELPEMTSPPVHEVACGVTFQGVDALDPVLIGAYWNARRSQFPKRDLRIALGNVAIIVGSEKPPPLRAWLLSEDESALLQIQKDRFYYNWRAKGATYPRFSRIGPATLDELTSFSTFLEQETGTRPQVTHFELTKVNLLRQGTHWSEFSDLCLLLPALQPLGALLGDQAHPFNINLRREAQGLTGVVQIVSGTESTDDGQQRVTVQITNQVTGPVRELASDLSSGNTFANEAFSLLFPRDEMARRFNRTTNV